MFLREIKTSVTSLHRVGKSAAADFASLGIRSIADLLLYPPRTYQDRVGMVPLAEADNTPGRPVTVNTVVEIIERQYFGRPDRKTLKVIIEDETGRGSLVCFGRNFLSRTLIPGKRFFLYGAFQHRYGERQSSSFDFEPVSDKPRMFKKILPVYRLSGKLTQALFRYAVSQALKQYAAYIENELPDTVMKKLNLWPKASALKEIHFPSKKELINHAQFTLKFEELFYLQFILLDRIEERKKRNKQKDGIVKNSLRKQAITRLPFPLTSGQQNALEEISTDFSGPHSMTRLMQGDVGSGKTLVALLASLQCIESGMQVAFMAPTELLAVQHADTAASLLSPLGVRTAVLTGTVKGDSRRLLLDSLAGGKIDLILGTHALFSRGVRYNNLGLVIVDEQHRFGVLQRLALLEKGPAGNTADNGKDIPDLLLMSATPIPRTLSLTVFGDLDISTITTMPPGRKPVKTHLAKQGREQEVYARISREIDHGRQAYFIYPVIEESERINVSSAEKKFLFLKETVFPRYRLGLIHSRLVEAEKRKIMEQFSRGGLDILVSTTVVEVGVDVPNATCMVIENAERFGLSTLHQLRGRVGRGSYQSYAFLIFNPALTDAAKQRLQVMKETNDGFLIAEEDLKLRGPGEMTGTKQSGNGALVFSDLLEDYELLQTAREEAAAARNMKERTVIDTVLNRCSPFSSQFVDGG